MKPAAATSRPAPHDAPMHDAPAKHAKGFACGVNRARASVSVCTWIVDATPP